MRLRLLTGLLVAAGAIAALGLSCASRTPAPPAPKIPVVLNTTLTNELSDTADLRGLDAAVNRYLRDNHVHGASLAIMRRDSLVYAKGYGEADKGIPVGPQTLFRMASVSKLITATGIMVLVDRGSLSLDDKVFGPDGILKEYNGAIRDKKYERITVEHLLRHEGGFSSRVPDPMFSTRTLMQQHGWALPPTPDVLLKAVLRQNLTYVPGTTPQYSNLGYLILTLVIEKVTGKPYEEWMQENVLQPAGCHEFHLARNFYEGKYPTETRYYMPSNEKAVQCYDNSGQMVERCYGGNDIHGLYGAGAWVASVPELMRLVAAIDGRSEVPDIISFDRVSDMTAWFDDQTYSLGWNDTKETGEWTRTGSFSGTSALVKYYPDGECWIMILNTSTYRGNRQSSQTGLLFHDLRRDYSASLPRRDFFFETGESL